MTIKVISQTTEERRQETRELFEKCKPLLDQGYSLNKAAWEVRGTKPHNPRGGWFRELIDYAETQGYDYHANKWQRGVKVVERTSSDVDQETRELFEKCKPLLDQGIGFYKAIRIVKNIPETSCFGNCSWYKRFREYARTQGYKPLRGKQL